MRVEGGGRRCCDATSPPPLEGYDVLGATNLSVHKTTASALYLTLPVYPLPQLLIFYHTHCTLLLCPLLLLLIYSHMVALLVLPIYPTAHGTVRCYPIGTTTAANATTTTIGVVCARLEGCAGDSSRVPCSRVLPGVA